MPKKQKLISKFNLSKTQLIFLLATVAAVGGFLVYRSFAASDGSWMTYQQTGRVTCASTIPTTDICNDYGKIVEGPAPSDRKVWSAKPEYENGNYRWNWWGPFTLWDPSDKHRVLFGYRAPSSGGATIDFQVTANNGQHILAYWRCKVPQSSDYKVAYWRDYDTSGSRIPYYSCGQSGTKTVFANNWPSEDVYFNVEFRSRTRSGTVFYDYVKEWTSY